VVKAALLNTARVINGNELSEGQGIVDFKEAYDLITSLNIDENNIPEIVSLTPKVGPINYLTNIPHGMIFQVPLTLVSSHPMNTSVSFTGDLNGAASHSDIQDTYSQILEIIVDTNLFTEQTKITGNVSVSLNGYTVQTRLEIDIGEPVKGKIGIDLGHTYWDDTGANGIGGGNTGEMIKLAFSNGYSVEHVHDTLNSTILQTFDIFWMADPINLIYANNPSLSDQGFIENPLRDSEIEALKNYVDSGGSLLVTFNGFFNETDSSGSEILLGSNATGINSLIDHFGITAYTEPIVEPFGHLTVELINQSSIAGKAKKYTHYGNYLHISSTAEAIAMTNGGLITAATYGNPSSGGRVLVSASNYWLDNVGITGNYFGAGEDNQILAENTLSWLTQDKRIIKTSKQLTSDSISGSFVLIENSTISNDTPVVYLEGNNWVASESITPTNHGNGTYSFNHNILGEGIFRVIATYGNDYIVWELIVDNKGPIITPTVNNPNGTIFDDASFYLIEFLITDDISGVNPDSFRAWIDLVEFDPDITFRDETGLLIIVLRSNELTPREPGSGYKLEISVNDKNGNTGLYKYYFEIGLSSPTSSLTYPTTSASTNATSSGDSNFIFDNFEFFLFFGLVSIILYLTYKNYKLRKTKY
jgi:hypothetical protein